MPPPSRRSAAARGASTRQPAAKPAPVEDAVEPGTEELEVAEVASDGTEAMDSAAGPAAPPAGRSGRSAAASSRRGAARSGRGGARSDRSAPAKSRPVRELTPEEIAARRARLRLILTVLGASAAGILLLVGLFFLLKEEDPRARTARDALTTAQSLRSAADRALDGRDPVAAAKAIADAETAINIPELDFASDPPNLQSPHLADPAQALQAAALKRALADEVTPRLKRMEREIRVEINHRALDADFGRLGDATLDLADLESRATAFIANPVEPEAGPNEAWVADHSRLVERIRLRLPDLEREKRRRDAQVTSDPVRLAEIEVQNLIRSERFADAKARIAKMRSDFPRTEDQAGMLDRRVDESARKTWAGIEQYVQTRLDDIQAAGTPPSRRSQAAQEARDRLDQVLNTFGLEDYLSQARTLRDRLPTP
jgi:hypothetical protein